MGVNEFSTAVRAAVATHLPDTQMVLDGMIVVETLDADQTDPVLHVLDIGNPSDWVRLGMLRAGVLTVEDATRAGWQPDEEG